ncbi:MAG: hypothetical protein ABIY52_13975 [Gemmatimonadaceae bacterium]
MEAEAISSAYTDAQLAQLERLATVIDRATPTPGGLMRLVTQADSVDGYTARARRSTPRYVMAIPDDCPGA